MFGVAALCCFILEIGGGGGEGVNGREHPVFVLSSASTDKWMGGKTAVTLQLFLVCLCICECWIRRTVCLESSHFFLVRLTRCIPQNPVGISGAWRRDLDLLPSGSLKGAFAGHSAGPAGDRVFSQSRSPARSALLPLCPEETEHRH